MQDITKTPRIFHQHKTLQDGFAVLEGDSHHYLKNVLRAQVGDHVRLFNEQEGEYAGTITVADKKYVRVEALTLLRVAVKRTKKTFLLLPPLKKERMDMAVEKAVELDVTDIYPVLTQNCDVRKINPDRILAQMIEAAEQCERMDIPCLHPLSSLQECLSAWDKTIPVYAGIERSSAPLLAHIKHSQDCAFLVGPAGGLSTDEKTTLTANPCVVPVSLGPNILRAETAVIAGLALLSCR